MFLFECIIKKKFIKIFNFPADELSASSSPGIRRSGINGGSTGSNGGGTVGAGTPTPSSGSGSRNQSPRPRPDTGEARLRPGVTGRSSSSSRNSANLTSSTLQEDLMKLINPDYMSDDSMTPKVYFLFVNTFNFRLII